MKRSEMVELIRKFTNEYNESPQIWFDSEFADLLLKKIESARMLPPPKTLDVASGMILYYYVHDSIEANDSLVGLEEIDHVSILWAEES